MGLKIYNTMSGRKEDFYPLKPGEVTLYACGPTVYDEPHIGHLRSAYVFDVARKALRFLGHKVTFARNVTDVDDKIIDRARQDKVPASAVAEKYLKSYHESLERFGIEKPDEEPKATDHIEEMKKMIARLVETGAAYASAGSVYFRVRRSEPYGDLSHRKNLDELFQNTRKEAGEGKEDPFDFALWKRADDEPNWGSPWGKGRPGWHIECSAMSTKYLGETFDIHGGGLDLLFPHHENERAQSMAASGKEFARVWMHHGLVTVDGQKMSKSLKNYVTLDEVLKRGHSIDALKLFFLQSHYRSDVDFTWKKLELFDMNLKNYDAFFEKAGGWTGRPSGAPGFENELKEAIQNDFDTPMALSVFFKAYHAGNVLLKSKGPSQAAGLAAWIIQTGNCVFGLFEKSPSKENKVWQAALSKVISLRNDKRKEKQYKVSDFIRTELTKMGFEAEDGKEGTLVLPVSRKLDDKQISERLERLLDQAKGMK